MTTGFFGIPGREPTHNSHKVHVVDKDKPVCGTRIHPKAQYQWCAHGIERSYVECERCKAWIKKNGSLKHGLQESDKTALHGQNSNPGSTR